MRKVLIANRGEIAVRIIGACAQENIESIAIYADSDATALHTVLADHAYSLEGISPAETYLNIDKVLAIAKLSGATDVHPGYGFLAENADFARAVIAAGLTWIGPSPETIELLGDKVQAREVALLAKAPLAPGTKDPVAGAQDVLDFAKEHGLPIVIKAAHGGGGRGMRVVWQENEIEAAFESAQREAIGAFGNGECFVERFLDRPRHVETQVAADTHGNVVVLGTRDCSLQRRHQKLIEEAPAPFLSAQQEQELELASQKIFAQAKYVGIGTCEFLIAQDGTISFLEVNTRIQVEHPVTEETTGIDLVKMQFDIAAGAELDVTQTPAASCHAIEFRINAEDPARGFLPSAGTITSLSLPGGANVRWDSGVRAGTVLDGSFDSLLAKLIVTGKTRQQALRNARLALKQLEIEGIATVVPFARMMLERPEFTAENADFSVYTTWIDNELLENLELDENYQQGLLPVGAKSYPGTGMTRFTVELDGKPQRLGISDALFSALGNTGGDASTTDTPAHTEVLAPMGGILIRYTVQAGEQVAAQQQIGLLEAMKTEVPLYADSAGTVEELLLEEGTRVQAGQAVLRFA